MVDAKLFIIPKHIPLMTIGSHGHAKSHGPRRTWTPATADRSAAPNFAETARLPSAKRWSRSSPCRGDPQGATVTGTVNGDWSSKHDENAWKYWDKHMKKCFCHWQHQVPNGFENLGCPVQGGAPGSWVGCYHSKALWWIYPDSMVVINQTYNCGAPPCRINLLDDGDCG